MIDLENRKYTVPEIRFLMGMKQKDLAEQLGVSANLVWRKENGKSDWTMKEIQRISLISGIPVTKIAV